MHFTSSIFGAGASNSRKKTKHAQQREVVLLTNETEGRVSGGDRAGASYIRGGSDGKSRNIGIASPRPWRIERITRQREAVIKADDNSIVAVCHADNAELIVKSVNLFRGGSDGKSRNGEAEAVANAVGRESVAMDESSNTCTKSRPSLWRQFSRESGTHDGATQTESEIGLTDSRSPWIAVTAGETAKV